MIPDVLIIGGGVIGLTTAWRLAKRGLNVEILEQAENPGRESSWAGAGIIPPGNPVKAKTEIDLLRATSSSWFPGWSEELKSDTGIDNGFRVCGGIECPVDGFDPRNAWIEEGIEFETIRPRDLEPKFQFDQSQAFFLPCMGQVRNPWHLQALTAMVSRLGVQIRSNISIQKVVFQAGSVARVVDQYDASHFAKQFLIAGGAWSQTLLDQVGIRQSQIHPVRGQIVQFQIQPGQVRRIIIVGKNYVVPREDGLLLFGATEEPELGFSKIEAPQSIEKMVDLARDWFPILENESPIRAWSGLRPGSLDGFPLLGRVPDFSNLLVSTGHYRAGIQLSPASAELLAREICDESPLFSMQSLRPDREHPLSWALSFRS
jgi:glycine oxidase